MLTFLTSKNFLMNTLSAVLTITTEKVDPNSNFFPHCTTIINEFITFLKK